MSGLFVKFFHFIAWSKFVRLSVACDWEHSILCVCVYVCVFLLCMNLLDVQGRRHFPDEVVHCLQRAVVSTQPATCTHTHTYTHAHTPPHTRNGLQTWKNLAILGLLKNSISLGSVCLLHQSQSRLLGKYIGYVFDPIVFQIVVTEAAIQKQNNAVKSLDLHIVCGTFPQ